MSTVVVVVQYIVRYLYYDFEMLALKQLDYAAIVILRVAGLEDAAIVIYFRYFLIDSNWKKNVHLICPTIQVLHSTVLICFWKK